MLPEGRRREERFEGIPSIDTLRRPAMTSKMSKYVNDLGTRLFQSVTNKAGDLGDRFEEEFSKLSQNITEDVDAIVNEAITLSPYIKVALVCLSILLVLMSIRLICYGIRVIVNKRRRDLWLNMKYETSSQPIILMVPSPDGSFKDSRIVLDKDGDKIRRNLAGMGLLSDSLLDSQHKINEAVKSRSLLTNV